MFQTTIQNWFHSKIYSIKPNKKTIDKDIETLAAFIDVYCRNKHQPADGQKRCAECEALLQYAIMRRARCPYDPKPACKHCVTHCYKPEYRQRIKEIMKFSGIYFIKRGRLDWLIKYYWASATSKKGRTRRSA